MARIRTIKPEFFTSEDITLLSPLARLFYISLWCESDRQGRFEWKPGTFKLRYFPGDSCDINELASELIERSIVVLYSANGKQYAEIPTFTEHQVINNREADSTIPARDIDASRTRAPRVKAEGKEGREGKGKEGSLTTTPDGVSDSVWQDFLKLRKAKKAPITKTAIDGIAKQAQEAGLTLHQALEECCARGWQGFKASWLVEAKKQNPADVARSTVPSTGQPDPELERIKRERAQAVPIPDNVREKLAALRRVA